MCLSEGIYHSTDFLRIILLKQTKTQEAEFEGGQSSMLLSKIFSPFSSC